MTRDDCNDKRSLRMTGMTRDDQPWLGMTRDDLDDLGRVGMTSNN